MNADFELIDTHAHLYSSQFNEDRNEMMQRALQQGVKKIYLPNIDSTSIEGMMTMTVEYPDVCYPMMGLHPCSVNDNFLKEMEIVESWLGRASFSAIGEIGTDMYWDTSFGDQQVECFKRQIALSKDFKLPIVIHSRESLDLNIEIVGELQDGTIRGIFHCFTGTIDQANRIIDLGFLLGIGGVVTFKNSALAEVVAVLPLESLVLETDAPYLTPHPFRGKRNETSYIRLVAEKIATCRKTSFEEVCKVTAANARHLFT